MTRSPVQALSLREQQQYAVALNKPTSTFNTPNPYFALLYCALLYSGKIVIVMWGRQSVSPRIKVKAFLSRVNPPPPPPTPVNKPAYLIRNRPWKQLFFAAQRATWPTTSVHIAISASSFVFMWGFGWGSSADPGAAGAACHCFLALIFLPYR